MTTSSWPCGTRWPERTAPTIAALTAVLGALWTIGSNYPRARRPGRGDRRAAVALPARARPRRRPPGSAATAVSRRASSWATAPAPYALVAMLRRLPPAPPDTLLRCDRTVVLGALPETPAR